MKTIGMIGGMTWQSTAVYYRALNQEVGRRRGGFHSARILIESIDFAELHARQEIDDWDGIESMLCEAALRLQHAGADFWLMACNTVHRVSDAIEAKIEIPFLHIADPAGHALAAEGAKRVGLLGTAHTMQGQFYPDRLKRLFGIETLVPDEAVQRQIHGLIMSDLCQGIVTTDGRKTLDEAQEGLERRGAQATLLACTELGLLYEHGELGAGPIAPVFDTAALHALAAVDLALD